MTRSEVPLKSPDTLDRWGAFDETLAEVRTSLADMPVGELDTLVAEAMVDVRGRAE